MSACDAGRWRYRGTCHKFGDDIRHDEDMISFEFVTKRVTEPELLIPHLFETMRPEFHKRAKAGDILIAGRNFGKGKAHIQAYIALKTLGVAIACESMPYKIYRLLVGYGVTFMTGCTGIAALVEDGDDVEIDFRTGDLQNHTRGTKHKFTPLPERALEIIRLGGTEGMLRDWWAKEQQKREE